MVRTHTLRGLPYRPASATVITGAGSVASGGVACAEKRSTVWCEYAVVQWLVCARQIQVRGQGSWVSSLLALSPWKD